MKIQILNKEMLERIIIRIAHEILERNKGAKNLVVIGIKERGDIIAKRIVKKIYEIEKKEVLVGALDITFYRDDIYQKQIPPKPTDIQFEINNKNVILVDDVLFTGRSVRSALDALIDLGRPAKIELAVIIDRNNRELPISADYVGKKIMTLPNDDVQVRLNEIDGEDEVIIIRKK
jgi:pyrimidine operon attenuation protein/uracil phosphoribosyltransferase